VDRTLGVLAIIGLPCMAWVTFRSWRDGEIFLIDEANRITEHCTRDRNPVAYWSLMALYCAIILGFATIAVLFFLSKNLT
jgi:hypothetical protein